MPQHGVHFFDDARARTQAVSRSLADGLAAGASALVAARPAHWTAIAGALKDRGFAADAIVVLDARTTLTLITTDGKIDPQRFDGVVGPVVRGLASASPVPPIVYGEMVDILASDGNFAAVHALEQCWNDLLADVEVNLVCGYSSAHFAVGDRSRLVAVCNAHTQVNTGGDESLGGWLVRTSA